MLSRTGAIELYRYWVDEVVRLELKIGLRSQTVLQDSYRIRQLLVWLSQLEAFLWPEER